MLGYYSIAEATYRLMMSMTALVFNLMLYILQLILGTRGDEGSHRFRQFTLVVLVGNVINCLSFYCRYSVFFDVVPRWLGFLLYMFMFMSNILLTYMFARYIEDFVGGLPKAGRVVGAINAVILLLSLFFALLVYLWKYPTLTSSAEAMNVEPWIRYVLGFAVELYFLFYAAFLFVNRRRDMERRAIATVITGFSLTIIGILLEISSTSHFSFNYFGATLGIFLFYFGAETPDYKALLSTLNKLEEATAKAESANRSKSDFLANMSHEIRTPINAVIGMNEMILRESRDENIISYAHDVDSAGKNLLALVNDILDFSKIEAGKIEIIDAPYRLSTVINDMAVITAFRAKAKGLTFDVDVDETLPDNLIGDEVRIRRVISNVLNNAVKYTHEGGVVLSVRGKWESRHLVLEIAVKDTGIGIREEDLPRLFTRFDRLDMAQNKTIEGTGLGLAITGSLMQMMGGSVNVESTYGKGSTFTLYLTQNVVSKEPIGDYRGRFEKSLAESRTYQRTYHAPSARVLVVDDTVVNLTVVKGLLKQTQIMVDLANSGIEALELTQNNPYDVILMDQRMPRMNGTQALHRIRSQIGGANCDTPVICLTADAIAGARERYIAEGFSDYLTKPIDGKELEKLLLSYIPADKIERAVFVSPESGVETSVAQTSDEKTSGSGASEADRSGEGKADQQLSLQDLYASHANLHLDEALANTVSEDILTEVLKDYYDTIEENAAEIRRYFESDDLENYTIKVHALKSSSRLIGAMELSETAKNLEACGNAAKEGDADAKEEILQKTEPMLADYLALRDTFAPFFGDNVGPAQTDGTLDGADPDLEEIDPDALTELVESLRESMQVYDIDTMESLLKQTTNYKMSDADQEQISALKSAVRASDWDRIREILKA